MLRYSSLLLWTGIACLFSMSNNSFAYSENKSVEWNYFVPDTSITVINYEMLRMFEVFNKRGVIEENIFQRIMRNPEYRNPENWRQVIEEYREAIALGEDPIQYEEFITLVENEVTTVIGKDSVLMVQEQVALDIKSVGKKDSSISTDLQSIPDKVQLTVEDLVDKENTMTQKVILDSVLVPDRKVVHQSILGHQNIVSFHIQIAASRSPLDESFLRRIYSGDKEIICFNEDNWHKYYIGEFDTFTSAQAEANSIGVKGTFVISFCLGKKILAFKARQVESVFSRTNLTTFHTEPDSQFRIQIAASRFPLSDNELSNLYPNIVEIGIIYEDSWYKYSIPGSEKLKDSKTQAENLGVKGAFVVRYQMGKRIPIR